MMRSLATFLFASAALAFASPAVAQSQASETLSFISNVRDGDASGIVPMLEGPDASRLVNSRAPNGDTPLTIVVRDKRPRWVLTFLEEGANPDTKDGDGMGPIHYATQLQHYEMMEMLLRRGANPNLGNRWNETALMIAVRLRNPRMVKMLLDNGADPDVTDSSAGLSARDYARRETRLPELLEIIENHGKPKEQLQFGPILR